MGLLALTGQLAVALPPAPGWSGQEPFARVFGLVPRFAAGSLIAYWAGEFTNSYTMAGLKMATRGRWLWTRTVGSTVSGQAVDTAVFTLTAFWGTQRGGLMAWMIASSYAVKVAFEVAATPLTYLVVDWLKRVEGADAFDDRTDFNPFAWLGKSA